MIYHKESIAYELLVRPALLYYLITHYFLSRAALRSIIGHTKLTKDRRLNHEEYNSELEKRSSLALLQHYLHSSGTKHYAYQNFLFSLYHAGFISRYVPPKDPKDTRVKGFEIEYFFMFCVNITFYSFIV